MPPGHATPRVSPPKSDVTKRLRQLADKTHCGGRKDEKFLCVFRRDAVAEDARPLGVFFCLATEFTGR